MSIEDVLLSICDYNHNYRGCLSFSESLFLIDKIIFAMYSFISLLCIYIICYRTQEGLNTSKIALGLILMSNALKILQIAAISFSFPTSVILHYLSTVNLQISITMQLMSRKNFERMVKLHKFYAPNRQTVESCYSYVSLGMAPLTAASNIITVLLLAFDSISVNKYRTYHFIQFIATPFYYMFVAIPVLIFSRSRRRKGASLLSLAIGVFKIKQFFFCTKMYVDATRTFSILLSKSVQN